jgi:glycosyltransferase involved in cell wall biosynthesis
MKISIVIPVYNEVETLRTCLEAISLQTKKPHEVIVVDNNSVDGTSVIAKKCDFVTLIHEPRQGVIHARTKGFNKATGDIIARIDGDTILPADWLEQIDNIFSTSNIDAVSGKANYYGVACPDLVNASELYFRRKLSKQLGDFKFLWGANMAMRRSAWKTVRPHLCKRGNLHEDFDIAIHMQKLGMKVGFEESLEANVSFRRIDTDFLSFTHYVLMSPKTYAQHDIKVKRYTYTVALACMIAYLPGYLLNKGYDAELNHFSLNKALFSGSSVGRVDPTANVV